MTLTPDRETFEARVSGTDSPTLGRLSAELPADTDPITAYGALAEEFAFLFESGTKTNSTDPQGEFMPTESDHGCFNYSYVGYDPAAIITVNDGESDVTVLNDRYAELIDETDRGTMPALRSALPDVTVDDTVTDAPYEGGLLGFLGYDAVYDLWLDEHGVDPPATEVPDAQFVLNTKTIVFDHQAERVRLVYTPVLTDEDPATVYEELAAETDRVAEAISTADVEPGGFSYSRQNTVAREEYLEAVERTKEHVLDGDIFQGVISRERTFTGELDPLGLYEALKTENPSPYMYLLRFGDRSVVGASPETLVGLQDGSVFSNPLAGTCERGTSPLEDRRNAAELLGDKKEQAEHVMLVDLARNDIRQVCRSGSVSVEKFMSVIKQANVQHIESLVTGELTDDADAFDTLKAAFPVGTLSGAPKRRTMEIIDKIESTPRGIYGGGVGFVSWRGDADFGIAIRTATVEHCDHDYVTVRAGAGVVADSDPDGEYVETEHKMASVLQALNSILESGDPIQFNRPRPLDVEQDSDQSAPVNSISIQ